jgi:hypothetical protein
MMVGGEADTSFSRAHVAEPSQPSQPFAKPLKDRANPPGEGCERCSRTLAILAPYSGV